ncbi:MAG: fructosamine kinase family protein, partial [Acidobacteriota bacterium]
MSAAHAGAVDRVVRACLGADAPRVVRALPVSGGSISRAWRAHLDDGSICFVKTHDGTDADALFAGEAAGLDALAAADLRVPRGAVAAPAGARPAGIVMEAIDTGPLTDAVFARLGAALAAMHRRTAGARFGFDRDNHIGATPQPNGWCDVGWCFHR